MDDTDTEGTKVAYEIHVGMSHVVIEVDLSVDQVTTGRVVRGFNSEECTKKEADVLERFLLALACEDIDVDNPQFIAALETTLEALANA
jgi:hypothetical protein